MRKLNFARGDIHCEKETKLLKVPFSLEVDKLESINFIAIFDLLGFF